MMFSVESQNFRATLSLSFRTPDKGLVLIDGKNKDTGGSNGAAKSTCLDLIFWVLYGYIPRGGLADNVIHFGEEHCWGKITDFPIGNELWTIERHRPLKLIVHINGEKQERKAGDLQGLIHERFMPSERFLIASYVAQDREKSFFSMTDTERTKLLSTIAQLEPLDRALQRAKKYLDTIDKEIAKLNGSEEALKQIIVDNEKEASDRAKQLEDTRGRLTTIENEKSKLEIEVAAKQTIIDGLLADDLKSIEKAAEDASAQVTAKRDQEIAEITKMIIGLRQTTLQLSTLIPKVAKEVEPAFQEAIDTAKRAHRQVVEHNQNRNNIVYQNQLVNGRLKVFNERIESIQRGKCGECGQPLPEEQREAKVREIEALRAAEEAKIKPVPEELSEQPHLDAINTAMSSQAIRKMELNKEPDLLRAELEGTEAQIKTFETRAQSVNSTAESKLSSIKMQAAVQMGAAKDTYAKSIAPLKKDLEDLQKKHEQVSFEISTAEKELKKAHNSLQKNKFELEATQKAKSEQEQKSILYSEAVELFGPKGYRAVCYDSLVARISEKAGAFLSALTDGLYTTQLIQVKEDANGNGKIVLRPIILKGGQEFYADCLSGGQLRRVHLAYDLAVNCIAGDGLPLFLDEGLNSLDAVGKFQALPLLQEIAQDRAVMLIDHTSELISAIDTVWTAVHENGVSYLEVG